jgi:hypothetical protein
MSNQKVFSRYDMTPEQERHFLDAQARSRTSAMREAFDCAARGVKDKVRLLQDLNCSGDSGEQARHEDWEQEEGDSVPVMQTVGEAVAVPASYDALDTDEDEFGAVHKRMARVERNDKRRGFGRNGE